MTEHGLIFSSETISARAVSIELYGEDYSVNPDSVIIKLTLMADMSGLSDSAISSISGAEIDLNIDWTQFEVLSYVDGTTKAFESQSALDASFPGVWQTYTDELNGMINKLVVASIDTASNPAKTLVDNVDSTGLGVTDRPSSLELGSIYLKPIAGVEIVDFSYSALVMTDEGSQSFNQTSVELVVVINEPLPEFNMDEETWRSSPKHKPLLMNMVQITQVVIQTH